VLLPSLVQEFVLIKLLTGTKVSITSTRKAHLKISIITIYYTLVGVVGLVSYTIQTASAVTVDRTVLYALCESRGQSDCRENLGSGDGDASTVAIVMLFLLPVVVILFNCNPQACCTCSRRRGTSSSI
jgi:hypothetical protein